MGIGALRRTCQREGLRRSELAPRPMEQFARWFEQARTIGLPEHDAMGLGTVSADGLPRVRTIRLREFDDRGFSFFTHEKTTLVEHLEANPAISLLFLWSLLDRQVIVEGRAVRLARGSVLRHFLARPRGQQLETWLRMRERAAGSGKMFLMELDAIRRRFANREVPLPRLFTGFRVAPRTVEFWQGRRAGLPDRVVYSRDGGESWRSERR